MWLEILRRFQQPTRQVARAVHDTLHRHTPAREPIENEDDAKGPTHGK